MQAARMRVPLAVPPWGEEEINEAIDSLRSGMLTMGKKVGKFERLWAEYIGVKHAVMTNSGSSANLLMLSALRATGRLTAGEIITPGLTWATSVFPIAQAGFTPVLVDVRDDYNLSPEAVEAAITRKTRAILPVHLLGNPCDMDAIMGIARRHKLLVLEDACEAHGAEYHGQKVGSFGDAATFSFFFSHHISTVEGGMVVTNDDALAEACRSMRAFGWIRELEDRGAIAASTPDVDPRFLFLHAGYNFRPTEIGGAFGMHQVGRLEGYIDQRRLNARAWNNALSRYEDVLALPKEQPDTWHVSFSYALTVREGARFTRAALQAHLEERGIETRPIEAGCMSFQPAMREFSWRGDLLLNATRIHHHAFFIGNHHGIGQPEREYVAETICDFMRRF